MKTVTDITLTNKRQYGNTIEFEVALTINNVDYFGTYSIHVSGSTSFMIRKVGSKRVSQFNAKSCGEIKEALKIEYAKIQNEVKVLESVLVDTNVSVVEEFKTINTIYVNVTVNDLYEEVLSDGSKRYIWKVGKTSSRVKDINSAYNSIPDNFKIADIGGVNLWDKFIEEFH